MFLVFLWITQSYQSDFDLGINVFINTEIHCESFRNFLQVEHVFFFDNDHKTLEKMVKMSQNGPQNHENYIFKKWKRYIFLNFSQYPKPFNIVLRNGPNTQLNLFSRSKIDFNILYGHIPFWKKGDQIYRTSIVLCFVCISIFEYISSEK